MFSDSDLRELEQTSSAKSAVWWASVERVRAHLVEVDLVAAGGGLEGGFGAGEASADDSDSGHIQGMCTKCALTYPGGRHYAT